ncbi:hypothetical protein GQ600_20514 [Phytophthora cactorum]|nr:hypothetical protein GQ600_20514 [Phytophthora cactorum]
MPPKQNWTQLADFHAESDFTKYSGDNFCCSAVYAVNIKLYIVCPVDHDMTERRLRCQSPTCEDAARPLKCLVTWKVHHCASSSTWRTFTNDHSHARGVSYVLLRQSLDATTAHLEQYAQSDRYTSTCSWLPAHKFSAGCAKIAGYKGPRILLNVYEIVSAERRFRVIWILRQLSCLEMNKMKTTFVCGEWRRRRTVDIGYKQS